MRKVLFCFLCLLGNSLFAQPSDVPVAIEINNVNVNDGTIYNYVFYLGGWAGGGLLYDANSGSAMLGLTAELSVAKYFSVNFDLGACYTDDFAEDHHVKYNVTPYLNINAHIPFRFKSGFSIGLLGGVFAGHPEYFGGSAGATLGYKIKKGMLFLDLIYLHSFYEFFPDGGVNANGYIAKMGYKARLDKK